MSPVVLVLVGCSTGPVPIPFDLAVPASFREDGAGSVSVDPLDAVARARSRGFVEGVVGDQDYSILTDATAWPYRTAVKLIFTIDETPDVVYAGSGVMFEDTYHVLTAGHAVYSTYGYADTMTVIPAYNEGDEPFGAALATTLRAPDGWTTSVDAGDADLACDIGLVTLDRPIGERTGELGWEIRHNPEDWVGDTVQYTGYPYTAWADGSEAVHSQDTVQSVDAGYIFTNLDSGEGSSGSGIYDYWESTGEDFVGGVLTFHTYDESTGMYLSTGGPLLDDDLLAWIEAGRGADTYPGWPDTGQADTGGAASGGGGAGGDSGIDTAEGGSGGGSGTDTAGGGSGDTDGHIQRDSSESPPGGCGCESRRGTGGSTLPLATVAGVAAVRRKGRRRRSSSSEGR